MNTPTTCMVNGMPVDCGPLSSIIIGSMLLGLLIGIIQIIAFWKMFEKAGRPGWASIVPIYNMVLMLQMIKKPEWWVLLMFIPFVNIVIWIIVCLELAKAFGKGTGFGIGLILVPFIFFPILAFDKSRYVYGEVAPLIEPAPVV